MAAVGNPNACRCVCAGLPLGERIPRGSGVSLLKAELRASPSLTATTLLSQSMAYAIGRNLGSGL